MQEKSVYYRDGATMVCLLVREGSVVARGLSVCSRADEFSPKMGRMQALARAREAAGRERDCSPIKINAARSTFTDRIHMQLAADRFGVFKGYFHPRLSPAERLILGYKN